MTTELIGLFYVVLAVAFWGVVMFRVGDREGSSSGRIREARPKGRLPRID